MGLGIVDSSLSFGQQNFFWTNSYTGSSVSGDDSEYAVYQNRKGTILIAKYASDGSSARYISKKGDYDIIVAARGSYNYTIPKNLLDQSL